MPAPPPTPRPTKLLSRGNRRLADAGVYTWTLPALSARLNGVTVRTCPSAGICAHVCYALAGTYRFANVRRRHLANLAYVIEDLLGWEHAMKTELTAARFTGAWVRIHDAGDFFSDAYTRAWLRIMHATPHTKFYCYTKEIRRFRHLVEPEPPENFLFVYSFGGRDDQLLDDRRDRVADVFPTRAAIEAAGWHSQEDSDLLAVLGPAPVGIPANRIAHFLTRLDGRTFRQWQAEDDARRGRGPCSERVDDALRRHPRRGPAGLMRAASHRPAEDLRTDVDASPVREVP
ncbi:MULTISPECIES: GP88 family protein [unclassified Amycolatopsis]|uniref:GP88 family protein n=1 Tax=unclassified Amycolatopsis TaxID=2618356 RepID=UPI0028750EAE|nr:MULTISPECIES: hypothetical protein [unclassified Amycolatopsis]MDS0140591.1 hypothetical protein [Amycolatopsis sp. 505]MDS0149241.1 hypothetical protein [Amycolatopsis sp. CM201R]